MQSPFVGRASHLSAVLALLEDPSDPRRIVAVPGEPGIGKTRFLAEVTREAAHRGWPVQPPGRPGALPVAGRGDRRGARLIAIDDAHSLSLDMDTLLSRLRSEGAGDVVLLAYRPRQVRARLAHSLAALEHRVRRVALQPLREDEADALIPDTLDLPARRTIYAASGGNPAYLDALIARATGEGGAERLAAFAAEISGLPRVQLRVARLAAAFTGPFRVADLVEVAGIDPHTVHEAVQRLVASDVLRIRGEQEDLEFRHPLVRYAIYRTLTVSRRASAHERIGQLLERRGADVVSRAHHAARCAAVGDEHALRIVARAAARLTYRDPDRAAEFHAAVERLAGTASVRRRRRSRLARVHALMTRGRLMVARDVVNDVRGDGFALDPAQDGRECVTLARLAYMIGNLDEAASLLRRGLASHLPSVRRFQRIIYAELAVVELLRGDFDLAHRLVERSGSAPSTRGLVAVVLAVCGDDDQASRLVDDASVEVDSVADGRLAGKLAHLLWLSLAEMLLGRLAEAARHQRRGVRLARERGQEFVLAHLLVLSSHVLLRMGDTAAALSASQEARALADHLGSAPLAALSSAGLRQVGVARGDSAAAAGHGRRALDELFAVRGWVWAVCHLLVRREQHVDDPSLGLPGSPPDLVASRVAGLLDVPTRIRWYETLLEAALIARDDVAAGRWLQKMTSSAGGSTLSEAQGFLTLAKARISRHTGDGRAALVHADQARRLFAETGDAENMIRAGLVVADALAVLGDHSTAVRRLTETAREAQLLGLEALRVRATRQLDGLAPVPGDEGDSSAHPMDSLSRREREVAALVATGKTNREIAADLFLSVKTVERHLARIFVKVGVSSRSALAAMVAVRRAAG
ncbi:helix-turn-helix transcriptional regulator [Micromonospora auratinigra]|uniref:AAA ATPase domain-containing protein n=1 Tax=Micromonospora auratinigra TaxID=261654 RepID=A0A1A8Z4F3_9ACTN|nr:LuxR family transcriptional regulator [Micromonospora auratinigra]SBT38736.1 AAA ATPase domain-containing protein [Micromonospora auratinigra]